MAIIGGISDAREYGVELARRVGRLDVAGVFGQGYDGEDSVARVKAVAECLERLCLQNPQPECFVAGEYSAATCCDPALFRSWSREQVASVDGYVRDVRGGRYQWWPATDYATGERVLVPAQLVFLSDHF